MQTVRRRAVLAGIAAVASAAPLSGCLRTSGALRVAVVWSGGELKRFRGIVAKYGDEVEVISTGNNIEAFLHTRSQTGGLPEVAIVPQLRLIRECVSARLLEPIRVEIVRQFDQKWNAPLTVNGIVYGAWVKVAHKSLFWYLPGTVSAPVPSTWGELRTLTEQLAGRPGGPAPLSIGAADGWVLTDWLENLLAGLATKVEYDALAHANADWRRQPVLMALRMLGELWRIPGAFPSGPSEALLTQFDKSVLDVFANRRAAMVFEGDFVAGLAREYYKEPGLDPKAFRFPAVGRSADTAEYPLLVSGDAAVVFTKAATGKDSQRGHDFVTWLTKSVDNPFLPWIADGGFLSPNPGIDSASYPDSLSRTLATALRGESPRFDLSDQLTGALGGRDGIGIARILRQFFEAVTATGSQLDDVVDRTASALTLAARRGR